MDEKSSKQAKMMKNEYVILAAGNGTRLWPLSEDIPKCLVRIMEKPLIEWIVEAIEGDAEKIVIIIGDKKEKVLEHFNSGKYAGADLKSKIRFIEQTERKGTGHALLLAENEIKGDNFFVLNADQFMEKSFFEIMRKESLAGKPFIIGKKSDDAKRFGVLEIENGMLTNFTEKPQHIETGIINTATYYLSKEFFQHLKLVKLSPRGEYEATDAIISYAKEKGLKAVEFEGYWNDIGYYWNYLEANSFALSRIAESKISIDGKVENNVTVKGNLILGKGSSILSGTTIYGNVFIGENCIIGPNAIINNSTIESNCRVGMSELTRSIVLKGSNFPHFNYAGDSVIGENCNFGAGTKIANLRFDGKNILVEIKGKKIDSHKTKLGAAVGSGTKTGINSSINCGVLVAPNSRIMPGAVVSKNV